MCHKFWVRLSCEKQKSYPSKHFLFSKTSSRRLEDVFSVTLFVFQDVFKTSSRRFQDVFKTSSKASSRRLQDVFVKRLAIMSSRRLQDVFKTPWKTKKCYTEDVFKTSSVCLHQGECLLGCHCFLERWLFLPNRDFTCSKSTIEPLKIVEHNVKCV